jgi:glycerate-2-kinase
MVQILAPRALRAKFDAAVAAAQPALSLPPHLPAAPKGRLIVIGAGKASAAMARAVDPGSAALTHHMTAMAPSSARRR